MTDETLAKEIKAIIDAAYKGSSVGRPRATNTQGIPYVNYDMAGPTHAAIIDEFRKIFARPRDLFVEHRLELPHVGKHGDLVRVHVRIAETEVAPSAANGRDATCAEED